MLVQRPYETSQGQSDFNAEILGGMLTFSNLFYDLVTKNLAPFGISKSQFDILGYLYYFSEQSPVNLTELSKVLLLSKANVSGVLSRLEDKGLIHFIQSRKDARVREIRLTDKGKELTEKTFPNYRDVIDEAMQELSGDEKNFLMLTIKKLCNSLISASKSK